MDPGTFQRASCQRNVHNRRSHSLDLPKTSIRCQFLRQLTIRKLADLLQTSGFPGHLVVALLLLDSLGRGEPRNQRIDPPFAQNADAIKEIDGPGVEWPVEFLQVQVSVLVEEGNGIC